MLTTFIEGIGEVVLPCSVGLLLPGLGAVLLGWWRSTAAVVVFVVAAAVTAWLRAADVVAIESDWLLVALLIAALATAWLVRRSFAGIVVPAAAIGVFAGSTWRPCVGDQLADILNNAPAEPFAQLVPMTVYVAGVTLVLVGVALLPLVWPRLRIARPHIAPVVGSVIVAGIAIATVAGEYEAVLSEFAQLSVR